MHIITEYNQTQHHIDDLVLGFITVQDDIIMFMDLACGTVQRIISKAKFNNRCLNLYDRSCIGPIITVTVIGIY